MGFGFEKLVVYPVRKKAPPGLSNGVNKKAIDFANKIYESTKNNPKSEFFGITNQIRRASTSISQNIAEGSGRSKKEFKHFLNIARTSGYECIPFLEISKKQKYISSEGFNVLYNECNDLVRGINALKNSIREQKTVNSERNKR